MAIRRESPESTPSLAEMSPHIHSDAPTRNRSASEMTWSVTVPRGEPRGFQAATATQLPPETTALVSRCRSPHSDPGPSPARSAGWNGLVPHRWDVRRRNDNLSHPRRGRPGTRGGTDTRPARNRRSVALRHPALHQGGAEGLAAPVPVSNPPVDLSSHLHPPCGKRGPADAGPLVFSSNLSQSSTCTLHLLS